MSKHRESRRRTSKLALLVGMALASVGATGCDFAQIMQAIPIVEQIVGLFTQNSGSTNTSNFATGNNTTGTNTNSLFGNNTTGTNTNSLLTSSAANTATTTGTTNGFNNVSTNATQVPLGYANATGTPSTTTANNQGVVTNTAANTTGTTANTSGVFGI